MTTTTRKCTRCLEEKPIAEFNFKNKARGLRDGRCRTCHGKASRNSYLANKGYYQRRLREYRAKRRQIQRVLLWQYLESHPCVVCGEADPCCLDFDHVRGEKRDLVTRMIGNYAWKSIMDEISKCEVHCAKCHRKRHAKRRLLAAFTPL